MAFGAWLDWQDPYRELERRWRGLEHLRGYPHLHHHHHHFFRPHDYPPVNVFNTDDETIVSLEMPGVAMKDLDLSVTGGTFTLKGERKAIETPDKERYHRRERPTGTFVRTINLPDRVDACRAAATCRNGILTVTLPKLEEARPKKIEVKG